MFGLTKALVRYIVKIWIMHWHIFNSYKNKLSVLNGLDSQLTFLMRLVKPPYQGELLTAIKALYFAIHWCRNPIYFITTFPFGFNKQVKLSTGYQAENLPIWGLSGYSKADI